MKRIVSISIGSSSRDHRVETEILGEQFQIERIGTDGDIKKAIQLIKELDGKVDAFGMGGIDIYLYGKNSKRYILRSALPILRAAVKTPIVDGSGLKNTLERRVVQFVNDECGISLMDKKILLVCGLDRFGMAETLESLGGKVTYGDLIFALGIKIPINSLAALHKVAAVLMPIASRLPFKALYPTGKNQNKNVPKYHRYYYNADIIAGDFIYIKKHIPEEMEGKIILTNTVTLNDIEFLKKRGIKMLITSTPELNGRSFGTNVMEAVFLSLFNKNIDEATPNIYEDLITRSGFKHRTEILN
ncbi:MAG: quinate 5-dehydrogenase [Clostridiales bacterium]|nr:quinate 5-dehydrogenase [Clostridiales bacterium]